MEATLMAYEGPAVIDGEEVPNLRLRVFTDYDDGVTWPDQPIELLRGWEAEATFTHNHPPMWEWQDASQGVEVAIPGVARKGRAWAAVEYVHDLDSARDTWTVRFTGGGPPPVPES
ncbi:hypothetical protein [Streptomyces sp. NPDC056549]|uniref:hypothetical protein n=1 Tax=Streptomyces sp. NPDC056549 TaxID=3345864 RepID=UPI0036AF3995